MSIRKKKPPPRRRYMTDDPLANSTAVRNATKDGHKRSKKYKYHRENPAHTVRLPREYWELVESVNDKSRSSALEEVVKVGLISLGFHISE